MRYCSDCGHQNPDELQYCVQCAGALGSSCSTCGQLVPIDNKFCGHCGARLPDKPVVSPILSHRERVEKSLRALMPTSLSEKIKTAAVEINGERREVTVLFLDIANFTATAHALDSEDVYLLTDEAMRLLTEAVYKYEGTIDKYTGDGLMALFGAPVAHENDPERAVRAALEMHAVLQPLRERTQRKHSIDLQTRIGINTGLVIAGQVGSDLHMEYTVIGDTVNLADRLQNAADPGSVLVSFSTYQRTRPFFDYRILPRLMVKGKPHPIRAFQPRSVLARPGQVRGLPGLQVPMIGRQDALAQLQKALADVRHDHHSKIALITGEAGVGKSRLATEFRSSIAESPIRLYQGGCLSYARSKPFWLVANMLRDILHLSETDPAEMQREALLTYVNQLELIANEVLPYLTNVLGLEQTDPRVEARLRLLDSIVLQKLIHTAVRQMFLAEASLAPTVLVFEDLHWVDPASRDFLKHLIQTIDDVPLMLILISRDQERETVIRSLVAVAENRRDRPIDIQLRPLSQAEVQLLVDQLFQEATSKAKDLKRRIAERAEGNPFYAEEIVRMLMEGGGLAHRNGSWKMTPHAADVLQEVPGTLKGLILARFDRLSSDLRRTLQKAAVLGSSFPLGLLQRLNGKSPEIIIAQMGTLQIHQFLTASPRGSHESYSFRHALIQEVVYNTLLKRDRQKLHELAAHAIEQGGFWLPDERTEALAYHYAESANPANGIPYLITAAENAARSCAYEIVIHHYRRALALLRQPPGCKDDQILHVQIGLGQALKFVGEYAEATQILDRALYQLLRMSLTVNSATLLPPLVNGLRELADIRMREGAPEEAISHLRAGLDALGKEGDQTYPALWRSLMDRLAWVRFRQGKLEEAFSLASAVTLGLDSEHEDDPMTLASLYNTLGGVLYQQGDPAEAISYVERSLKLYRSLGYLWGMAYSYTNLGVLHYALGNWSQAAKNLEQSGDLQEQIGDLQNRALSLNNLGTLRQSMGEHEAALRELESSLSIYERLGDNWGIGRSHLSLAHLAVVESRFSDAASHVQAALTLSDALGANEIEARWLLALAEAEDDLSKSLKSAELALQLAREADLAEAEPDCRRVLGILHARAGDFFEAEVLLRESVDLCIQLNAPYKKGLALLELGRLYLRMAAAGGPTRVERRASALDALTEAIDQFESLGAAYDHQLSQSALNQLKVEITAESARIRALPDLTKDSSDPPSQALPVAEWHTAAILWLSLDPPPDADVETVFETLAQVIPVLTAIAHEYQGKVMRHPDGLLVAFGAPVAFEDDAERAVQTAWQILQYLEEPTYEIGIPLTLRVAVSQGDIVAGQIGSQLHSEFVVTGRAVEAAQQAAESAPSGTVWVTDAVRATTERLFTYKPPPTDLTSHLPDPSLWALVDLRKDPMSARGLPGFKARFIGREAPLRAMKDLSHNLIQQIGGLIWIEGEPGIGKSRLMREFTASMEGTGALIWTGKCTPQKSGHAFSLFTDLVSYGLSLQPTDTHDEIRANITQTIQSWPKDAQITRPYLEMLLGVWPSGLHGERLASLEPEQLRQQIFVALRRLCKSLASEKPLVVVLDDLHWIDPMSAELLQFLLTIVASAPILFVCAQRRQGADVPNDRLVKVQSLIPTQTVGLDLERLTPTESAILLNELLPDAPLPESLQTTILERSEGNPYFIEEFVRMLIELGHLHKRLGRWEINPDQTISDIPLPSSLETLIRSRIDALPPELKGLIQYAAVIGAPFETGLLATISGQTRVEATLGRLESRLLIRRGAEANQWVFNHSLIESVVYNTMLKARRKVLHQRVGQALETRWAGVEADHAEELAYHFTRADDGAKALIYLMQAGERATARYANEEAMAYFEQAALQLKVQPEATDRLRWRLSAGLGDVYRSIGRYADSTAALEAGLTLVVISGLTDDLQAGLYRRLGETAQKQGDLDIAREHFSRALALLDPAADDLAGAELARVLTGLAWTHFLQGRFEQAEHACTSSLEYARHAGALNELAAAENLLGGIYYRQSKWAQALHHTRRAMVLREQMGYTWGVAATLSNLGILAISSGDWNKARSFFERSLALRQEMGDVEGVAIVHNNLGLVGRDQGDLDRAEAHLRASLAVARPFEMGFQIANSTMGLAEVMLLKGEIEAAKETIHESLVQADTIGAHDMKAEIFRIQAEILLTEYDWDEARSSAEEATALAAETGYRSQESAAWRVMSEIELRRGDPNAAREALVNAQRAVGDATDDLEAGRLAALKGRIHLYEGRHTQAEADLRTARTIFMRLGADLDLKRVDEALKRPIEQKAEAVVPSLATL